MNKGFNSEVKVRMYFIPSDEHLEQGLEFW